MYIMCVCLFSALSRRVGALQISIIFIIINGFICSEMRMSFSIRAQPCWFNLCQCRAEKGKELPLVGGIKFY